MLTRLNSADHYDGLEEVAGECQITLFCTEVTHRLIKVKFPNLTNVEVVTLAFRETKSVRLPSREDAGEMKSVNVTALPANHCPGSAMFLFTGVNQQQGGGTTWLHTGDFRWCQEMSSLFAALPRVDTVVLDTTFCHEQFRVLPQKSESQRQIVELLRSRPSGTQVWLRCQPLGAEELFMSIKSELGEVVCVSEKKLRQMIAVAPELAEFASSNPPAAGAIHVVNELPDRRVGDRAMLIRASTMWSRNRKLHTAERPVLDDGMWNVLYSCHSSWDELEQFVRVVSPTTIVPLTDDYEPKALKSLRALTGPPSSVSVPSGTSSRDGGTPRESDSEDDDTSSVEKFSPGDPPVYSNKRRCQSEGATVPSHNSDDLFAEVLKSIEESVPHF